MRTVAPAARLVSGFCVALLGINAAVGANISVLNSSFEDFSLEDGAFTSGVTGLSGFGWEVGFGDSSVGILNPDDEFPLGIPHGENVLYTDGRVLAQDLSETLLPNVRYELNVDVGNALGELHYDGYIIQLIAGATVLAFDINTATPPDGGFSTASAVFVSPAVHPEHGRRLGIRFMDLLEVGVETYFDNIRLTATDIPEPSAFATFSFGTVALTFIRAGRATAGRDRRWGPFRIAEA